MKTVSLESPPPSIAEYLPQDREAPESTERGSSPLSALWTPDKYRQLSSALLLELFRRSFEFEVEQKDTATGPARKRRRRYDKLFTLGVVGSYGLGRTYAEFRDMNHLLEFAREIGRAHAFTALKDMQVRRIMWRLPHPGRALRLYVNPKVESWILDKRIQDADWKRKLANWADLYRTVQVELNFPDLPSPDQTILEALAEVNLAAVAGQVPQGHLDATMDTVDEVPQGHLKCPRGTGRDAPGAPVQHHHINMVQIHGVHSMEHALEAIRGRTFDVGALDNKTGQEILDVVLAQLRGIAPEFKRQWLRRIGENARLVWDLAQEARVSTRFFNKAGWMNRAYMHQMGVGQFEGRTP